MMLVAALMLMLLMEVVRGGSVAVAGADRWRGRLVRAEDVARLRENALLGQGSCSFAEPVADLHDMGWL